MPDVPAAPSGTLMFNVMNWRLVRLTGNHVFVEGRRWPQCP